MVGAKLEAIWQRAKLSVPIASMVINSNADCGLLAICLPNHSGGPYDVFRRIGISSKNRYFLKKYTNQFWPEDNVSDYFQPEPGCSDPTFRGSYVDVTGLAALMVNQVAKDIQNGISVDWSARGHLLSIDKQYPAPQVFSYRADHVINIPAAGTEVRLTDFAWREIQGWINRSKRVVGEKTETGGLLFGDLDEAVNVLWVNEVLGPPPDSQASDTLFECGVKGTQEANQEKISRSRGAISYVGTWHTHPISAPVPSETDYIGMAQILSEYGLQASQQLLLIAGYTTTQTKVGAHIFNASRVQLSEVLNLASIEHKSGFSIIDQPSKLSSSLGLTLSGGGSRAIAFHLGCLRALHDMNLLSDVRVISAVSGGSVMAALYAYEDDEFPVFENRVLEVLREGLVKPAIKKLFTTMYWPKIVVTWAISGMAAIAAKILRITIALFAQIFQIQRIHHPDWVDRLRAPLRRWYSITSVLESVLTDKVGDRKLNQCARENLDVIFNACEMRTGTAFRFSNNGSRSWRYGTVVGNDITVGHAVSASAAYPAMLPAHDKRYTFIKNGIESKQTYRAIVTDGGVYDNLGITAIEPGRYQKDSITNVKADVIICCDAGAGQFSGYVIPYGWGSRMAQAFESTFRKVQDASKARLHKYAEAGDIKAFIYAYLGQIDENLPLIPADLIPREEISGYPTDFFAMKDEHIEQLANRGEVLTRYLISLYLLDD